MTCATVNKVRQNERRIIRAIAKAAIAAGYSVSVHDSEAYALTKSRNADDIVNACHKADEEYLHIYLTTSNTRLGFVTLIYGNGNDGYDVISDYTTSLEPIMHPVNTLIDFLTDG